MTAPDRGEIYRYLGYRAPRRPDERTEQAIDRCLQALQDAAAPRAVYRRFALTHGAGDTLQIGTLAVQSAALSRCLRGCQAVWLMAATLGAGVDRLLARLSAVSMSDAVVCQAAAAALIEAYCDEVSDALRAEAQKEGLYCRPRFSPGYGDFSIAHQRGLTALLDTPRRIGLTVTESCLLAPVKSVTAVIGLSETPQPCHRKGCEVCGKTDCAFRRGTE